ncbi:transketolase [Patescibacteria group bacterium]|nr:transketolase [Patescibacteria group bacterium]
MEIPKIGQPLNDEQINFLNVLTKSCRNAIVAMVANAQSGHPGGACSSIDYLATIYAFIISQTGEDVVVSNGHVSAAVYSILAEMGYIPREEVIQDFRKVGKIYEGHITRHVRGVNYGTGPLGVGVSVATGFAIAEKLKKTDRRVFAMAGDGECDEGQVYEMMHFANKYKLDNYTLFIDYNAVQLTDSLDKTMPINLKEIFESANWNVLECDGHNFSEIWDAVGKSYESDKPTMILGHTIMGKGVTFMEPDGADHKSTWHGIPPKPEQAESELAGPLKMTDEEVSLLNEFRKQVKWEPPKNHEIENLTPIPGFKIGEPNIIEPGEKVDCRGAYGKALLDLAKLNDNVVAMTADLGGSVKTTVMGKEFPERVFEVGIAEQHMVSFAGGLSLRNMIPFASTFGVFMTSRAKDQARLNDINETNVKMVSKHCGLSVGEDGPTHQTVDDMGSFSGFFNTDILEPADANQTDHIIRFIAAHYGNFYVRMGRHKFEVLTKEDGTPFYDDKYKFELGKADVIRKGDQVTVVAVGSMVNIALDVAEKLKGEISVELIAMSSFSKIDIDTLVTSLEKTGKIITIEDHNPKSGWANQINSVIAQEGLSVIINNLAVRKYQLSGKPLELYDQAGIGQSDLEKAILAITS